ncbi:hypothetical protein [Streptomyces sp. NPDC021356]|uniref:hypothetical protein n=1 Tax=Streptomyces sp. NPDC021356 TaxID=3154900 RepID=UPI0033ED760F
MRQPSRTPASGLGRAIDLARRSTAPAAAHGGARSRRHGVREAAGTGTPGGPSGQGTGIPDDDIPDDDIPDDEGERD